MRPTRTSRAVSSLLLTLTLFNVACSSWSPVTLPAPADTTWSIHHRMRVTDSSGTRTIGLVAVVRDSTLVVTGLDRQDHSFPFQQVLLLEREHTNILGTIGILFLVAGMINLVLNPPPGGVTGLGGSGY